MQRQINYDKDRNMISLRPKADGLVKLNNDR